MRSNTMCQLFAINSNVPTAVTFSWTGLAARGGRTDEHADGWGVAFHTEGGSQVFRDEHPAAESPLASFLCQHPIRATTVIAHIRKATLGAVQLSNCHPFQHNWAGRTWSFAHNGTLNDFHPDLAPELRPVGTTDSERAFGSLMQMLRARFGLEQSPEPAVLAPVLQAWADDVSAHGTFNFLLTDGQALYAYCSTHLHLLQRSHPFVRVQLTDEELSLDLSEENQPGDQMMLVATKPLTMDEPWEALQQGELALMVGGTIQARHAPRPGVARRTVAPLADARLAQGC